MVINYLEFSLQEFVHHVDQLVHGHPVSARHVHHFAGRFARGRIEVRLQNVLDVGEVAGLLAVVCQHPFILNERLSNNVTTDIRELARDELEEVCHIAYVDEFAEDLPNGFDSILGGFGVRLSGGQRQKVALARVLLRDVNSLVLDETTSNLDSDL